MSTDSSDSQKRPAAPTPSVETPTRELVAALSRSQQGYRDLIDNLDQAVFTLSLEGEVRVANRRLSEILGVSFQSLIGHRLSEFVESPSVEESQRALPVLLKQRSWSGTLSVRLKRENELRRFACWFQALTEEGGTTRITGWARDVTLQHEAERRFTELFESLREGIIFATPGGRVLDANPALIHMLGYDSKEDLASRNFREAYADPAARDALVRLLEEQGAVQDYEIALRRKDGREIRCLTSGFAIRDASGRPVRLQGVIVDVTERREIEKKLRREQEFVRRLVECFPDLIGVLDRESNFTFVTERVKEVLGLPPQEFLGKRMGSRTHPDDQPRLMKAVRDVLTGQKADALVDFRVRHADGDWRTLRASVGPLFDEEGKIAGVVQTARDVTESNRLEEQLARKEKFAAMGEMLAGAAHELNNPLTAILGVSDLLRERATDDATRRQVDLVLQQARRAAGIVQGLLAVSRPPTQQRSELRIETLVQEALQSQQAALRQKNIAVKFEVPGDLPAIDGDRKLLMQVFLNIIANAEQSISPARDHGTLEVSLTRDNGRVRITFADDGPGIAPENLAKIFDPFFTTKRPGGGSGLGLTICLAVVKDHGGTIEVQSTAGAGASFHVLLPAASSDPPAVALETPAAAVTVAASKSDSLRGRSVLVVDDEEGIRELIRLGLTARGMKIHGVESAEAARSCLATSAYDVILCDFNLPGSSGKQFFEELRARPDNPPPVFVFMTGELVDEKVSAACAAKGACILQKPFNVSALAAILEERLAPQPSPIR